ncbi:hypothetical protein [Nocardia sp. NPDC057455]|uniref:hypothetical protein n=1 Tax=Nocardia sp. NPDC057455 TaxID=3346138 RepID=UPI003670D32C
MTDTPAVRDADPRLIAALGELGLEYGALGVALAAAMLSDPALVVERLADTAAATRRRRSLRAPLPRVGTACRCEGVEVGDKAGA